MKIVPSLFLSVLLFLSASGGSEVRIQCGMFDTVTLYVPPGKPESVVIFISGDGGWNLGVVGMARLLAGMNAAVAGVNIVTYLRHLASTRDKCSYPAADFEMLNKYVQQALKIPEYIVPILVGYSSGATLAYALAVQAPPGTFAGALSMGFCPDLPLAKPFCEGYGLQSTPLPKGNGWSFLPKPGLATPWIAFQGDIDRVCGPASVGAFAKQVGTAVLVSLPHVGHGFSVEKNWVPQFKAAFLSLAAKKASAPAPSDTAVAGLPLVELPATGAAKGSLAVLLTGDGGWAGIDRDIAAALSRAGVPVVGFNTLGYFWRKRTPEAASQDLERIIRHYMTVWKKRSFVLIGYSFGADVLPFLASRLAPDVRGNLKLLALLGLSDKADFQIQVSGWFGGGPSKDARPVMPELEKLHGNRILYFYGTEEKDNVAGELNNRFVTIIPLPGGHHFAGRFGAIADSILTNITEK